MREKKFLIGIILILSLFFVFSKIEAEPRADILYQETDLGNGWWQYDYVFSNTSTAGEYLYSLYLYPDLATVDWLNIPLGWDSSFWGFTPIETDFLDTYSTASNYDIAPGDSLSGFSFKINYRAGNIPYEAFFDDHQGGFSSSSGTTYLVPEPTGSLLLIIGGGTLIIKYYRKKIKKGYLK